MTLATSLHACTAALADPAGPNALYRVVQQELGTLVGHKLFTLLVVIEGGAEVERIWTSDPASYPLQGRKPMGPTEWGARVLTGQRTWMCNDAEGIRWAFFDHTLIASLGLGACLSVPVVAFGRTMGTINILDAAGSYAAEDLEVASLFAPVLAYPMSLASSGSGSGNVTFR